MFRKNASRLVKMILAVFMVALILPSIAYAEAPVNIAGTGYNVGDTAYDFSGPNEDGNTVSLYQFYGRYTILAYDAAWCQPSRQSVINVRDAIKQLAAQKLPVQSVTFLVDSNTPGEPSTQNNATLWANYYKITNVLHMNSVFDSTIVSQFQAYSIPNGGAPDGAYPTLVFLDPRMTIIKINVGVLEPDVLRQIIKDDLIAKATALKDTIAGFNLDANTTKSLNASVSKVIAALKSSTYPQAHLILKNFSNQISFMKQVNKISASQAAILTDQINLIDDGLGY